MGFIKSVISAVRSLLSPSDEGQKIVIKELRKEKRGTNPAQVHEKSGGKDKNASRINEVAQKKANIKEKAKPAAKDKAPRKHEKPAKRETKRSSDAPLIEDFIHEAWDASTFAPEKEEGKTRFIDLNLPNAILRGINDIGFQYCTDIQAQILPHSLKGTDVSGKAQTGTGKTAAFLITIIEHLMKKRPAKSRKEGAPRALVMAPTRELVMQIEKDARELAKYCGARILAIFGGIDYEKQKNALEDDYVDIVIATPGRMLDYYKQKVIRLDHVEILVLDEADRMLDMGFLPDMRRIIDATPSKYDRQTMLFSATLPPEIIRLAAMWTNNPISVEIEPEQVTSADVDLLAYIVSEDDKFALLYNLLHELKVSRAIIFANRKEQVRKLTERLKICNFSCDMLTGDVTQARRIKTLENLRAGKIDLLIATDVAGRGIHVESIDVVFNYTLPNDPDDYVHRIGRTGRAGAKGISISFASEEDSYVLPQIEEHIKDSLKYITPDETLLAPVPEKYSTEIKNLKRKKTITPVRKGGFDKRKRKK